MPESLTLMVTRTGFVQVGLQIRLNGSVKVTFFSSGTRRNIQIWDLQKLALAETTQEMSIKVWMLSYFFPFVYVVGGLVDIYTDKTEVMILTITGEDWDGFKMFNVRTGEKHRDMKVILFGSVRSRQP